MKHFLLPHLICPACLPKEIQLDISVDKEKENDIIAGLLLCRNCKRKFPIREGIALLLPNPDEGNVIGLRRYEESEMVDRYLWSHYSDLTGEEDHQGADTAWADCLAPNAEFGLDAGCSVGRLTFEMAVRSGWAIGCDLSLNFIKTARRLARDREIKFSLPLEGNIRETFHIELPETWSTENIEFVVADALKLPFARGTFQQSASLNLLDRVSYPLAHLYEMNRVARVQGASFLFASPFSWDTGLTPEELWLGGTITGQYKGRGIENVWSLLEGKDKILTPPWAITNDGTIKWKLRTHSNHYEVIKSYFLTAIR